MFMIIFSFRSKNLINICTTSDADFISLYMRKQIFMLWAIRKLIDIIRFWKLVMIFKILTLIP